MASSACGAVTTSLLDARHRAPRQSADVLLLGHTLDRIQMGECWYERSMEPVAEVLHELGQRTLHLERHDGYRRPRHDSSRLIQPVLDLCVVAARVVPSRPPATSLPGYEGVRPWLSMHGLDPAVLALDGLVRQVARIEWFARYFDAVLRRAGARAGVLAGYDWPAMGFHLACRRLGIPSIELQHGAAQGPHFAYTGWPRMPKDGYELLPAVYWTWSTEDAAVIRAWADKTASAHRVVVGGNLFLNRWVQGRDPVVEHFDRILVERQGPRREREVLCTLQNTLCRPEDLRPFRDALATTSPGWRFWIRTHPACSATEVREARRQFAPYADRAVVLEASDLPLYALLRHVDAHTTINSATVIEAAALGVPSVVLDRDGSGYFAPQVETGWAVVAPPEAELVEVLTAQIARRPTLAPMSSASVDAHVAVRKALQLTQDDGAPASSGDPRR
jgi:hypothetical protein